MMSLLHLVAEMAASAPQDSGSSTSTGLLAAVLGAGGLGAIIAAAITGLFSKRKLGAEATEIITKAAAGVVTNMQAELDRQSGVMAGLSAAHAAQMAEQRRAHEQQIEEIRQVLQLHVAWDTIVIAKMQELGVELPPVPPLMPPNHNLTERH